MVKVHTSPVKMSAIATTCQLIIHLQHILYQDEMLAVINVPETTVCPRGLESKLIYTTQKSEGY